MDELTLYKELIQESKSNPVAFSQLEEVINNRLSQGETPLLLACRNGENETAAELIALGANVKLFDCNKLTPLHFAVALGTPELLRLILANGGDVNSRDFYGKTPLHLAMYTKNSDLIRTLVEAGADVNAVTCWFDTPLDEATRREYLELVESLDPSAPHRGTDELLPLNPSFLCTPIAITEYLYRAQVRRVEPNRKGYSPFNFLISTMRDKVELVRLFINHGAYIKPADYCEMLNVSLLKKAVLQDAEMCSQALLNKYNNEYLATIHTKEEFVNILPNFEEMKAVSRSKVGQDIAQIVDQEIKKSGHCNVMEVRPIALFILSLKTLFNIITTEH